MIARLGPAWDLPGIDAPGGLFSGIPKPGTWRILSAVATDEIQNRYSDAPDLEHLRSTSRRPSLVTRVAQRVSSRLRTSMGMTVVLALTIFAAIAIAFWMAG